jgi:hypothetical protein
MKAMAGADRQTTPPVEDERRHASGRLALSIEKTGG